MPNDSTKQFVEVAEIRDGILVMKDGSLRAIIEVTAINFDLRSDEEQIAITNNFQAFLNAIDFPVQISVVSRPYDISQYINIIQGAINSTENELLKIQATEYQRFIKELSELSNIVSKKFYITVPFYSVAAPTKEGIVSGLKGMWGKGKEKETKMSDQDFETYSIQLLQRAELIYDGIITMGLKGALLREDQLKNLLYQVYNPSQFNG